MKRVSLMVAMAVFVLAAAARADKVEVSIVDHGYSPATVRIKAGDTVVWTNDGEHDHTVDADDGSFSSGTLKSGKSFQKAFKKKGTYTYNCQLHPRMKGKVVVE